MRMLRELCDPVHKRNDETVHIVVDSMTSTCNVVLYCSVCDDSP
jgi:hypothetical protein